MQSGKGTTRCFPSPPTSTPLERASEDSRQSVAKLKRSAIHQALLDPVSSDPSDSSPLTKPRFPDGKKTLLSHLKPRGFHTPPEHHAFDRAAAGGSRRGKENERIVKKRAGVVFSPNHLESLLAKPSHRFTPYTKRAFVYSAGDRQGHTPPSSATAAPIKRPHIEKFNLLSNKQPIVHDRMEVDEEYETDDEADSEDVEHLLLSNVRSTSSPLAIVPYALSLPTPRLPKSILKQWSVPIRLVKDAIEGSRRNGGKIKHTLNFNDSLNSLAVISPYFLTTSAAGVEASAIASGSGQQRSNATAKKGVAAQSGGVKASSSSHKGGGAGAGNGGGDKKRTGGAPTSTADPPIIDPSLFFLSPLLVLNASLRPLSAAYVRQQQQAQDSDDDFAGGFVPRSSNASKRSPLASTSAQPTRYAGPLSDDSDESEVDDSTFVPILLPEIESAYIAITRCIVNLPTTITSPSTTFRHLLRYQNQLLSCLERDITNVAVPLGPSSTPLAREMANPSSSMVGSSSPLRSNEVRRRKGVSASEMRRTKDEIQAALAGIKTVAAICRDSRVYSIFSNSVLIRLVKLILEVPHRTGVSHAVKKDVFPFLAWFFSVQKLPSTLLQNLSSQIIDTLAVIISTVDKPRRNLSEGILAVSSLIVTLPEIFLPRYEVWLPPLVSGLMDFSKNGAMVRMRAVTGLSDIVWAIWNANEEGRETREEIWEKMAALILDFLHRPAGAITNLDVLLAHLTATLSTDEGTWAIQVIALLPAILGPSFRQLSPSSVTPWMKIVGHARKTPLKSLASLVWNHLVYAFVTYSVSPTNQVWIFQTKGFSIISQTIGPRATWGIYDPPVKTAATILKAQIASSIFVGILYGLSSLARPFYPMAGNYAYNDHEISYLDVVWNNLFDPFFVNFTDSKVDEVMIAGWKILNAVVHPQPSDRTAPPRADVLLNSVLLDGSVARARTDAAKQDLVARVLAATVQPEQVIGWSSRWVVSRTEKLLGCFEYCLGNLKQEMIGVEWKCDEDGARIMPMLLFEFWTTLMTIFAATDSNPIVDRNLAAVFISLEKMASKMITSDNDVDVAVFRLMLTSASKILGERFFSALSAIPKVSAFDLLVKNVVKIQVDGSREFERPALLDVFLHLTKDDSTRRLPILVLATKAMLAREKTKENSSLPVHDSDRSTLAVYWTKELREQSTVDGFEWEQVICMADLFADHLATRAFDDGVWLDFAGICIKTALESGPSSAYFADCIPNHAAQITELTEFLPLALALAGDMSSACQKKLVGILKPEVSKLAYHSSEGSEGIAILARALESVGSVILVPILELILDETSLLKDPSSTMTPSALLLQLTPILRVAFSRVLLDTHQTQSRSSETGIEVMSKYWKKNFDNDPSLQIPAELVDSLSILRKLSDIAVPSLLESQAEESVSQVAAVRTQGRKEEGKMETVAEMTEDGMGNESLEAPPPGQRASSPVQQESLVADPDSLQNESSLDRSDIRSGYNADISLSQATIPASAFGRAAPRQMRQPSPSFQILEVAEVVEVTKKRKTVGQAEGSKRKSRSRATSEIEDDSPVPAVEAAQSLSQPPSSQKSAKASKRAKTRAATTTNEAMGSIASDYAQMKKQERRNSGSQGKRSRSRSVHSSEASAQDESMDLTRVPETIPPPRPARPAAAVAHPSSSQTSLFGSFPRAITAPDEVVRMFFDLPEDDVMALIRTNHGIPTMERLRALGQRATEWVAGIARSSQGSQ